MSRGRESMSQANNHDQLAAWFSRMQDDARWFLGQAELVQRHEGSVVVLYNRQVVGRGADSLKATKDAQRHFKAKGEALPPTSELLFVPLTPRSPLESQETAGAS